MPVFFFLYPGEPTERLTAISLAVVFCNAVSGSIAYGLKGRIDFRSGLAFILASIPGALLGASATHLFERRIFDPLFAVLLLVGGAYLYKQGGAKPTPRAPKGKYPVRVLKDREGQTYRLSFSMPQGLGISGGVGFLSSVLGIGGGILHVPALVRILGYPVHIATATSHFILAFSTGLATLIHVWDGALAPGLPRVLALAPGVILGAQLGAWLSPRIRAKAILRALALALIAVAIRLLAGAVQAPRL